MLTRFAASQSVELAVPEQPISIEHYLRQPQRLVQALVDPSRVEILSGEHFRLKMKPLSFMMLSLQPTVDMRVWSSRRNVIYLQSTGCEIRGIEYINQRFSLELVGELRLKQREQAAYLEGRADLAVSVEMPPALQFTPRPLLEATGNGLLKSVLLTVKQRLMHQLLLDYRHWVQTQAANEHLRASSAPLLGFTEQI